MLAPLLYALGLLIPLARAGLFDTLGSSSIPTVALPVYSNSTKIFPTVVPSTNLSLVDSTLGRYGHSAVFMASSNRLFFIGGQLGDVGTTITNQVLVFTLGDPFLWGNRSVSVIPNNPLSDLALANGLPAQAWSAAVVDRTQRIWMMGGIVTNCVMDSIAYVLDGEAWVTSIPVPSSPPRRRQAQSVVVKNNTVDDIWVFGGIAEPFTCSLETIGYLGYDRWSTGVNNQSTVESLEWTNPAGVNKSYAPPVSDFTATLLNDSRRIVFLGGQTAEGLLLGLGQILVFDVVSRVWTLQVRLSLLEAFAVYILTHDLHRILREKYQIPG